MWLLTSGKAGLKGLGLHMAMDACGKPWVRLEDATLHRHLAGVIEVLTRTRAGPRRLWYRGALAWPSLARSWAPGHYFTSD